MIGRTNTALVAMLAIVIVIGSIGIGYAYSSVSSSVDNGYNPYNHIYATDYKGDTNIQIPSTTFTRSGDIWVPEDSDASLAIDIHLPQGMASAQAIMAVEFLNPMSWNVIDRLSIYVNGVEKVCYTSDIGNLKTCYPTEAFTVSEGSTYSIHVSFLSGVSMDPRTFTGDHMGSIITFIQAGSDPLGTN